MRMRRSIIFSDKYILNWEYMNHSIVYRGRKGDIDAAFPRSMLYWNKVQKLSICTKFLQFAIPLDAGFRPLAFRGAARRSAGRRCFIKRAQHGACVPTGGLCDRKSSIIPGTIRDGMLRCDGSAAVCAGLSRARRRMLRGVVRRGAHIARSLSAFGPGHRIALSCAHVRFFCGCGGSRGGALRSAVAGFRAHVGHPAEIGRATRPAYAPCGREPPACGKEAQLVRTRCSSLYLWFDLP